MYRCSWFDHLPGKKITILRNNNTTFPYWTPKFAPSGKVNPQFAQNIFHSTVESPPCWILPQSTLRANTTSFESRDKNDFAVIKLLLGSLSNHDDDGSENWN